MTSLVFWLILFWFLTIISSIILEQTRQKEIKYWKALSIEYRDKYESTDDRSKVYYREIIKLKARIAEVNRLLNISDPLSLDKH